MQVLLHSCSPQKLYLCSEALKALLTPLQTSAVYIPLLPHHLMSADEAATLLFDCSTPYLIGCETALLASLRRKPPADAAVANRAAHGALPTPCSLPSVHC